MGGRFETTRWSVVVATHDTQDEIARRALKTLCETYWYPLYAYVRDLGYDADEASDLTQGFFLELLEKDRLRIADQSRGRFRSFLLASLRNYISHQRAKSRAVKRGGDTQIVPFDKEEANERYEVEASDDLDPESLCERHWAQTVVEICIERLRKASTDVPGLEARHFERLLPYVTGAGRQIPYAEMAQELETTTSALKSAVHRLRKRLGELLRDEIAHTVADAEDVDSELHHLLAVVRPWEPAKGPGDQGC